MNPIQRALLITAGSLCVGLGVAGIFLPLLPTTPFLLLAAVCYARSSPRLLNWLMGNRWLGPIIRNYREGRGIPRREKILAIAAIWLTIGLSIVFAVTQWWARILLALVAVSVTLHLLRMKTAADADGRGR